ncbi:hypothetical protein NBRC111893_688 [Lentilactobacillus kosonis]|uniref:Uncharacterized protein n=1 Tax=Lentilactobacillus kosonis TaxID=2810561 RepID=A0A401FJK2_9LACO|nr:hypothetical protein NBRC111893_688 [Lentilactobacillus kosonis]
MFNKKEDTNRFSADIDELMDTNQNVDIIVDKILKFNTW